MQIIKINCDASEAREAEKEAERLVKLLKEANTLMDELDYKRKIYQELTAIRKELQAISNSLEHECAYQCVSNLREHIKITGKHPF